MWLRAKFDRTSPGDAGVEAGEALDAFVRVLADLPVGVAEIILDQPLEVDADLLGFADALVLLAVEDVVLGHVVVALLHQDHLDDVLDLLDRGDGVAAEFLLDHEADDVGSGLGDGRVLDALGLHGLGDGAGDLVLVEIRYRPVPLLDPSDRTDHRSLLRSRANHKPGNRAGDVLKSTLPDTMDKTISLSALSHILCGYCAENTKYCIFRADSTPRFGALSRTFKRFS